MFPLKSATQILFAPFVDTSYESANNLLSISALENSGKLLVVLIVSMFVVTLMPNSNRILKFVEDRAEKSALVGYLSAIFMAAIFTLCVLHFFGDVAPSEFIYFNF